MVEKNVWLQKQTDGSCKSYDHHKTISSSNYRKQIVGFHHTLFSCKHMLCKNFEAEICEIYWENNLRINPRPRFAKEYHFEVGIASTMQLYVLFLTKPLKLFLSLIGKLVKKKQHTSRLFDANNNSARNYV